MNLPKGERLKMYLRLIDSNDTITMKHLLQFSAKHDITGITCRRDIAELVKLNKIYREMGAYKITYMEDYELSRDKKKSINIQNKLNISKYVNEHFKDFSQNNDCIFIGSGTTMEVFARNISVPIERLYTYGVEIARQAGLNENIKQIYLVGGEYRRTSHAVCGDWSTKMIKDITFTASFFTATHVLEDGYIYNNNIEEAALIKNVMKKSRASHFLLDSSKFMLNIGGVMVAKADEPNTIVTDADIKNAKNVPYQNLVIVE
jgi:DeoR/GlpR family transcriptional regulator of sugar metabolism